MVWVTFLLAGYLMAYAPHHITIQIIDYVAKGRWLAVVKLFVNFVILATCLFLIYGSYTLVTTGIDQVTPAGGLSLRFVNAVPLVGLVVGRRACDPGHRDQGRPGVYGVAAGTRHERDAC